MTTESKSCSNEECDFCKRDEGLSILVTRACVVSTKLRFPDESLKNIGPGEINVSHEIREDDFFNIIDGKLKELSNIDHVKNEIKNEIEYRKNTLIYLNALDEYRNGILKEEPARQMREILADPFNNPCFDKYYENSSSELFKYGLGLLRSGYLYVYMPHIDKWFEYEINEQGFLRIVDNNYFQENSQTIVCNNSPCSLTVHKIKSLTITVPKYESARKIFFKFSEVKWSLKKKLENKKLFEKGMNYFDVQKYLKGVPNKYQFPISRVGVDLIKDFEMQEYQYFSEQDSKVFLQAPWTLNNCSKTHLENINDLGEYFSSYHVSDDKTKENNNIYITKYDDLTDEELLDLLNDYKKMRIFSGAIFCLEDIVGCVQDISSNALAIFNDKSIYTPQEKTLSDILALKNAFGINQNVYFTDEEFEEIEENKKRNTIPYDDDLTIYYKNIENNKSLEEIAEENVRKKENYNKAKLKDWDQNYQTCLSQSKYNAAVNSKAAKDKLKSEIIDELDQWALRLLKSKNFDNHYFFVTERNNPFKISDNINLACSVIEYNKALPRCTDYLVKTMYEVGKKQNFLSDAMCYSSDEIKKLVGSYINSSNLSTIPWGDLISRVNEYAYSVLPERNLAYLHSATGVLILNLAPYAARGIDLVPKKFSPLQITISGYLQSIVKDGRITKPAKGHIYDSVSRVYRAYYKEAFNVDVNVNNIRQQISSDPFWKKYKDVNEIKLNYLDVKSHNLPKNKQLFVSEMTKILTFGVDVEDQINFNKTDNSKNSAQVKNILTNDVPERLFLDRKISFEHLTSVGNFVFQSLAFMTIWNDKGLKDYDKTGRRGASLVGVAMAFTEGTSLLLSKYVERKMTVGGIQSLAIIKVSNTLTRITDPRFRAWRFLGASVAGTFAVLDLISAVKAYKEGERNYAYLLGASAISMLVASIGIMFSLVTGPFAIILILLSIGLSIYALYKRDKEIQKWLRRSFLGQNENYVPFGNYLTQYFKLKSLFE